MQNVNTTNLFFVSDKNNDISETFFARAKRLLLRQYKSEHNEDEQYKHLAVKTRYKLAVSLDLTVGAAVEELGVVGSAAAAGSVTIESLEWESVGVATAARLLTADALHAWLDWATGVSAWVKIGVVVSVLVLKTQSQKIESKILGNLGVDVFLS